MSDIASAIAIRHESQSAQTGTVLCVDDETNVLDALKRMLRRRGIDVLTAPSAAAALDILERSEVDVVLSDMRMPHMDGTELLERVSQRWPDTVRMILTGYSNLQSAVSAVNRGRVHAFLSKPWDEESLNGALSAGLACARQRRKQKELIARTRGVETETRLARLQFQLRQQSEQLHAITSAAKEMPPEIRTPP